MNARMWCGAAVFGLMLGAGAVLNLEPLVFSQTPTAAPAVGAATAPATGPARGGRGARGPATPASASDVAEMAKLNDLPAYAPGSGDGDYSIGPDYAPSKEQVAQDGVPQGKIVEFMMDSADSKFYPTANGAAFKRAVAVYIPAQYVPGTAAPFIVSCDQYRLANRQLPNILDNMIAQKRLPVMCAVMLNPGPGNERSIEYDTVSAKYTDFVESEVLPRAEKEANIKLTKDPEGRMTLGGSSGGIAAFTMAWFHPELYHRVLSYSGTFVGLQRSDEVPHGGWEYHENLIAKSPAKPLRIWIHVSQNDNGNATASSEFRNWVVANKHMAETLKAKGYHYQFVYAKNAGHTDGKVIAQTLPQALEYVWQGYPITPAK